MRSMYKIMKMLTTVFLLEHISTLQGGGMGLWFYQEAFGHTACYQTNLALVLKLFVRSLANEAWLLRSGDNFK